MRTLCAAFRLTPETRVLDVGGSRFNWDLSPVRPRLTFLNIEPAPRQRLETADNYVQGDGTRLPFPDQSFDVVYSNSVIEHLGSAEAQAAFAREVRRVGIGYYVQTPNRFFPVEPHLLAVGLHWLPRSWQRRLIRRASVWGWIARPSKARIESFLAEVRLLTRREMQTLFPDSILWTERAAGLPKSFAAVNWRPLPPQHPSLERRATF